MKKIGYRFWRNIFIFCILLFSFSSPLSAYTITTPTVNANDILTKSLWNTLVDDLLGLLNLINENIADISNINTSISNINTKFVDGLNSNNAVYMTGNVGIGTDSPTKKLDVNGDIQVSSGSDICIDGGNCLSSIGATGLTNLEVITTNCRIVVDSQQGESTSAYCNANEVATGGGTVGELISGIDPLIRDEWGELKVVEIVLQLM